MEKAIIGKKVGMTQIFDADGKVIPVTVVPVYLLPKRGALNLRETGEYFP